MTLKAHPIPRPARAESLATLAYRLREPPPDVPDNDWLVALPGLNAAVFAPAASAASAKPATPPRRRTRAVGLLGAVAQAREVGASAVLPHDQDAALAAFAHPPSGARTLGEATSGLLLDKQGINDAETALT